MEPWLRPLVLEALAWIRQGLPLTIATRKFWSQHGFPAVNDRSAVISAAKALERLSFELNAPDVTGPLSGLLTDEGYPTNENAGGVFGTNEAHIYVKVPLIMSGNIKTYRSFAIDAPWNFSIDQINTLIDNAVEQLTKKYGWKYDKKRERVFTVT